ncbi:MAG: amidohydrolase [Pararhodobacter sp.]|nr:amidohydrolase [Pararhodobacter sp.]
MNTTAWASFRRDLHQNPELGFKEHRTAAKIAASLRRIGCSVEEGIAQTGVVGTLVNGPGPMIGLRADMDALPMTEATGKPWTSQIDGVFHGCGHDGHVTCLLATAEHLAKTRAFCGTVVFIFQPAEEGHGGGRVMVEEGLFDRHPCDRIYGFHNMPLLPLGTAAVKSGPMMASFDELRVTFHGEAGHAAAPHLARDPVLAAADCAVALSRSPARRVDPHAPSVLSVTQIHGGTTHNVIPAEAWLGGTVRALSAEARQILEEEVTRISQAIAAQHGVECSVVYDRRFPVLVNEPEATAALRAAAGQALGPNALMDDFRPLLAAEDFAFMLAACPGAYILLGQGDDTHHAMVHNPGYDFNDQLIPLAVNVLSAAVSQGL